MEKVKCGVEKKEPSTPFGAKETSLILGTHGGKNGSHSQIWTKVSQAENYEDPRLQVESNLGMYESHWCGAGDMVQN